MDGTDVIKRDGFQNFKKVVDGRNFTHVFEPTKK